ncbi:MAG TPA: hypothetical protein VL358_06930 [Caulobacteraceae bacterium]|jgi:hypothetical protein|nr:hypothetical protein [Caulobacteraceae bacterium]
MGYTVNLTSSASQAEGSPGGTAASFSFSITRLAGDASSDGDNVSFKILNSDLSNATDFAVNSGVTPAWGGGLTDTLTITANADTTVETDETFFVWIYRNSDPGHPFYQGTVTLTNDDVGAPVFSTPTTVSVAENQTAVETAVAAGGGTTTYALNGGADAASFSITAGGVLTFAAGPDFEAGTGHGVDANHYLVTVRATSGGLTTDQNIIVNVTNVDDVTPVVTSGAAFGVNENTQAVSTMTATTDAASTSTTWSISGGADAAAFTIDSSTGALAFAAKPNFEHPTDVGADNVYNVTVKATSSGGLFATKAVAVTVADVVEPPVITSSGGASVALIHVSENTANPTTITTIVATPDDHANPTVYSITGGADAADFTINAATGALTFAGAFSPNFEAPADANGDNVYLVNVDAHSGLGASTQSLFIFVDNVVEPGDPVTTPGGGGGVTPPVVPTTIIGTGASEYLVSISPSDTIYGNGGADAIDGGSGNNLLQGGDDNDFIRGLDGDDTVAGGGGNDDVNGNVGNDSVSGEAGNDTVRGGQGDDTVSGGDGDDGHVNGNLGNDIVHGDAGADTVYGGQGNDTIYGDAGADQLSGDLGNDILYGGTGADRFMFARGGGQDWVADFNAAEGDRIVLAPGQAFTVTSFAGQVLIDLGGGDTIGLAGVPSSSFSSSWIVFS